MADPTHPAPPALSPLSGRRVLVTGGTGTFGVAFCRAALDHGAARVSVLSRSEAKQAAMSATLADERMRYLIGDVRDAVRVMDACRGVDIVIHAAALKRVETCEADPLEAVATNITGTAHVARACIERGVRRAVFLSTDKAAAPHTLYGNTKATAERLWSQANVYAAGTPTRFAATRYGNVLGSTGSVVPLWRAQLARGEAMTVTALGMTRFFMTIDDAVALVLLALTEMRGGEVFVPRVGATSVQHLACVVAGGTPDLTITGLRPGEKMHETLVSEDEARHTFDAGTHFVIEPEARSWETLGAPPCPPVPAGFTYRSDTARQLGGEELQRMVA